MARVRAALPERDVLRALVDGEGRIAVRVTPGARVETMEVEQGRVCIKVRAKPEDGKANDAVRELLARALGLPSSQVQLLRGATSREKQFRVNPE
ncbi:DUF167 domain-containing protein [Novosphingobium gossypii]|uniref:DUF167 domain-containing protein n=1 Tax=Novosphingobium gossypii TaxID=1604774 RepID=UPI003D1CF4B6